MLIHGQIDNHMINKKIKMRKQQYQLGNNNYESFL